MTEPIPEEQKWRREPADEKGWFMLTNPATGKVLTSHKPLYLGITGTKNQYTRSPCLVGFQLVRSLI